MWFPSTVKAKILEVRANLHEFGDFFKKAADEHERHGESEGLDGPKDYLFAYQAESARLQAAKGGALNGFDGKRDILSVISHYWVSG